ncbi:MAG: hypothetical protein QXJ94_00750 [Candidatus Bathyarchaeia archaeon]
MMKENTSLNIKPKNIPSVIAFFGPDGAGKSTQANLLSAFFKNNGFKVKRAWVRSTHTFAYLLWMIFYKLHLLDDRSGMLKDMRLGFAFSYLNERSYGAVSPITMSPPILRNNLSRWIWITIEVISVLPVIIFQVYLPLLFDRVVVAERFVVDTIASVAYFLGDENFINSRSARFLLRLAPRNTLFIFIDADYKTILERRKFAAGNREYTEFHRSIYKNLTNKIGAIYIDTTKTSILEANRYILHLLKGMY